MAIAAVRIRGLINIKPGIKKTLELLNLTRANHCVILDENPSTKGMLQTAKDYITWGEIDSKVLSKLISNRGKLSVTKKLQINTLKVLLHLIVLKSFQKQLQKINSDTKKFQM